MKWIVLSLAAMLLLVIGCNQSDPSTPAQESLDFDVISDDTPESFEAAMNELSEMGVEVPDAITDAQMAEVWAQSLDIDLLEVENTTLDEDNRPNFRRIIRHLHHRFRGLRPCLEENDDPSLRRVVYGAHRAMRRGIRALMDGHPHAALHFFHRSNRLLNLAYRLCREMDGGR